MEARKIKLLEFIGNGKRHLIYLFIKEIMIGKKNNVENYLKIYKI
jgi:hypothetical protein